MKYLIFLTFILFTQKSFCQASSIAEFNIKISFAKNINVNEVTPHYLFKSGNRFETIKYKKDYSNNSITIYGMNDFILWIPFPTLVFTLDEKNPKKTTFYLYSSGSLSSYTGKQKRKIKFSYSNPVIIASIKNHGSDDTFNKLKIQKTDVLSENQINLNNKMIRIYE